MEKPDLKTAFVKKKLKTETLILLQGDKSKSFLILHSGLVEILFNPEPYPASSPSEILAGSLRVGLIKSNALIDVMGLLNNEESNSFSIRTISNCIITSKPIEGDEFLSRMQEDIPLNLKILRDLVSRIESSFYIFKNYTYLWHKYASIADSLALGCHIPESDSLSETAVRGQSSLEEYANYLKYRIKQNGTCIKSENWDYNFFWGGSRISLTCIKIMMSIRSKIS